MSPEHITKTKLDEHWFVFWLYMWVCLKTGELKDPFRCLVGDQCTPGPPRPLAKQASLLQNHCTKAYAIWELRKMDPNYGKQSQPFQGTDPYFVVGLNKGTHLRC